jgi:hypothetical protein
MGNGNSSWIEALDDNWSGTLRLRVKGHSMWPTLHSGDQVTVESVAVADLRAGDLVLLRNQEGLFLHRLLGFTRGGLLLTKGDGHRAPDTPWSSQALLGRATALSRRGKTVAISRSSIGERARTVIHRLIATVWSLLHHVGLLILLLAIPTVAVSAAVTLISFETTLVGDDVLVTWETASEAGTSGFFIQRKLPEEDYQRISGLIQAYGDIIGATYAYTDTTVEKGNTYYYRLEDVQADTSSIFHNPISITIPLPPSPTPPPTSPPPPPPPVTLSPKPTSTPAPTSTPPTGTPPTATPTRTPTRTPVPSDGGGDTPTKTPTPAPTQVPTAEPSTAIVTATPEPDVKPSAATTTPDFGPAAQPTETPAAVAQATAVSPTVNRRPPPSPSPASTSTSLTHSSTANSKGSPFPWGLILALIATAGVLILLGGLGLWWMRQRT